MAINTQYYPVLSTDQLCKDFPFENIVLTDISSLFQLRTQRSLGKVSMKEGTERDFLSPSFISF